MGERYEKRNKSFTRERDCVCAQQSRPHERTMMTTTTAPRANSKWLAHGRKTSTLLVMLVIVTAATMQLAYLDTLYRLLPIVTTNTTTTSTIGRSSVVPSSTRSSARDQSVAFDDSHTNASTTTSRENNDREAATANHSSELSSTVAPTEFGLLPKPDFPTSDYVVTNLNDAPDYIHYKELSDFLEGPGVDDDHDTPDAHEAICEFRPVPWSHHFPHA
jgi:hypothetical protein